MTRALKPLVLFLVLAAAAVFAWRAWAPRPGETRTLSGYVEGDDLYLAAPAAGAVTGLFVAEGQRVAAGAPLFAVDPAGASAEREEAEARRGRSDTDLAAAEAQARQARAGLAALRAEADGARRDYDRLAATARADPQAVAAREIDQARAKAEAAEARRRSAEAEAAAAEVRVATARTGQAQAAAALKAAEVRLDRLAQRAPAAGRVETVFLQQGEWATPNQPVLALLPDGKLKIRFYVPEAEVSAYPPGRTVRFGCDGCRAGMQARIARVGDRPEFTPPVIYSRMTRDRLVFLAEATPLDPAGLAPGQPIDVEPLSGEGARR